ncbi:MAG: hypothetical protein QXU00_03215 [Ignisphaera sp.]
MKRISLEEIASSKEPGDISMEFYPSKLPWIMGKSGEENDTYYVSNLPR